MKRKEQIECHNIYVKNKENLRWYLRKYYGWLQEEDVCDVMQETWKAMCEHIDKVSGRSEAEQFSWLSTVAGNKAVSWVRSSVQGEKLTEKIHSSDNFWRTPSAEDIALERVVAEGFLEQLSLKERRTFLGEYLKPEIYEAENIHSNAVVCKRYRIRKKLQLYMKNSGMGL